MEPLSEPTAVMNMAAKAFLNAVGASSGPLYATALMRAGAVVKGKAELDDADVVAMLQAMAVGHPRPGQGGAGGEDHARRLGAGGGGGGRGAGGGEGPRPACLDAAVAAAREGAEATKGMLAGKGRAERLGERALGHVDPGAASAVVRHRGDAAEPGGVTGSVAALQGVNGDLRCTTHANA